MGNTAFWLDLLRQSMPIKIVPLVTWSGDVLLVYLNKLSPRALTALWRPGWQDDNLLDLSKPQTDEMGANNISLEQPLRSLFDKVS